MIERHHVLSSDASILMSNTTKSKDKSSDGTSFKWIYGLSQDEQRLYFSFYSSKVDSSLTLGKSLLRANVVDKINMWTDIEDCHIYILSNWVLNLIKDQSLSITSIEIDLLNVLIKNQFKWKLMAYRVVKWDEVDELMADMYESQ